MAETVLKYEYDYELQGYKIVGYDSIADNGILTIPDTYEEQPVIKIGEDAFNYCNEIKHLIIGGNIRYIGNQAFVECNNLETIASRAENGLEIGNGAFMLCKKLVSISSSLKLISIGDSSFQWCEGLREVNLSSSLVYIDQQAFKYCTGLISLIIPNSVTFIGDNVLAGCTSLKTLTIPFMGQQEDEDYESAFIGWYFGAPNYSSNPEYVPNSLETVIITGGTRISTGAFKYCESIKKVQLPNSITEIGGDSFTNSGLQDINIPDSVSTIGPYAFAYSSITDIVIPNSVETIGDSAFAGLLLRSLTAPYVGSQKNNDASYLGQLFGATSSDQNPDYVPQSLKKIILTDSDTIPSSAFKGCQGIEEIVLPQRLKNIRWDAFRDCSGLKNIEIPESVLYIGEQCFKNCTGLIDIIIPNKVVSIDQGALAGCSSLESITLPFTGNAKTEATNTYFGWIFGAESPSSYTLIPTSLKTVVITEGEEIFDSAFYWCTSLTSITIPDSVISIGSKAFYDCDSLTSVMIPDSVTSIGDWAFCGCDSLTSATIGNSITSISNAAFYGCTSLISVTIPDSVTEIGEHAFCNCENLTNVMIGDSVTSIGNYAFYGCTSLISVMIPDSVISIGDDVFYNCTSLASVSIGDSVTSIGGSAFRDCNNLTGVTIPDSVTSIGSYAFSGCTSLASVSIGNSVTSIGYAAFSNCTSLASVTIPGSVATIGQEAFSNCTSLTSVTIPDSVTTIGDWAFNQCTNLKKIYCNATEQDDSHFGSNIFYNAGTDGDGIRVIIGAKVKKIPAYIFNLAPESSSYSPKIVSVEFEKSSVCTSIDSSAFSNCPTLKEFIFTNNTSSYWDKILTQSTFSSDMTIDFKYFEPIDFDLQNFPYGASNNSTLTYAGDGDTDFTGFTFNGQHSWRDLNLLRVSRDRYTDELSPEKIDLTAENPGGNGQYYFGSHHKSKKFSIEIAFESLDESQLRKLKQLCANETMSDLIFDENPYKVYTAKITGIPSLKYICFNENGKRIYKGEGNIEFTCYWPYAHTPTPNTKISEKLIKGGVFGKDGKEFKNYVNLNKNDWRESSSLQDSFVQGSNYGDLPAPFILRDNSTISSETKYKIDKCEITVGDSNHTYYGLEWDSKTGLVKAKLKPDAEVYKPIFFSGTSCGGIPTEGLSVWGKWDPSTESFENVDVELEYDFWYY